MGRKIELDLSKLRESDCFVHTPPVDMQYNDLTNVVEVDDFNRGLAKDSPEFKRKNEGPEEVRPVDLRSGAKDSFRDRRG